MSTVSVQKVLHLQTSLSSCQEMGGTIYVGFKCTEESDGYRCFRSSTVQGAAESHKEQGHLVQNSDPPLFALCSQAFLYQRCGFLVCSTLEALHWPVSLFLPDQNFQLLGPDLPAASHACVYQLHQSEVNSQLARHELEGENSFKKYILVLFLSFHIWCLSH